MNRTKSIVFISLGSIILLSIILFPFIRSYILPMIQEQQQLSSLYAHYPDRHTDKGWDSYGQGNAMAKAIILNQPEKMKELEAAGAATNIMNMSVHGTDFFGLAMEWQRHECFDMLLSLGGRVDNKLLNSAILDDEEYYINRLLDIIKKPVEDNIGTPPFQIAVSSGKLDIVEKLYAIGYDINQVDYGSTALDVAEIGKHFEIAAYLKSIGAKHASELNVK